MVALSVATASHVFFSGNQNTLTMPRTAAKTRKKAEDPPSHRWDKLKHHDKVVCWNYHQCTATNGAKGWNPVDTGSVHHCRSSTCIQSLGSSSWFRHHAKLMVTLAEAFAARNEAPTNPNLTPPPAAAAARPQPNSAAFASTMNSPPPLHPGTPQHAAAGSPAPSVAGSIPTEVPTGENGGDIGIRAPTSHGVHEVFDCATRRSSEYILARTLLHNAVTLQDIVFEWMTPRLLKFRVAWPEFFFF